MKEEDEIKYKIKEYKERKVGKIKSVWVYYALLTATILALLFSVQVVELPLYATIFGLVLFVIIAMDQSWKSYKSEKFLDWVLLENCDKIKFEDYLEYSLLETKWGRKRFLKKKGIEEIK